MPDQQLKPAQPASLEASEDKDRSLEAQLDALLSQIEQDAHAPRAAATPAHSAPPPPPVPPADIPETSAAPVSPLGATSTPEPTPASVAAMDEPANESPGNTAGEDELSRQIQALLDQGSNRKPAQTEAPVSSQSANAKKPAADQPVVAAAAKDASPDVLDTEANEPVGIADLDRMLAEEADDTVAGDFETVGEVLSREDQPAEHDAATSLMAATTEATVATPESAAEQATAPAAAGFAASAADVAAELDDQPEMRAAAQRVNQSQENEASVASAAETVTLATVAMAQAPQTPQAAAPGQPVMKPDAASPKETSPVLTTDGTTPAAARPRKRPLIARLESTAHTICSRINQPLNRFSQQTRRTVGYVGLLTLCNAVILLIFALI